MMDRETYSVLEDMHFKYERLCSVVSCLWMLVAEGPVEIKGLPENALAYSLYEIEDELDKNNKILGGILEKTQLIKAVAS